ncbi:MAG TPA: hypothetical protein ENK23_08155 [Sorangium sp.]|nr:hypothetical protein [Sorangium sp.]
MPSITYQTALDGARPKIWRENCDGNCLEAFANQHYLFGRRPRNYLQCHTLSYLSPPFNAGTDDMKIAPWYLAALAPFAAIGYSGAHLGHVFVVLLTVGIFLGTLSMGRSLPSPKTDP